MSVPLETITVKEVVLTKVLRKFRFGVHPVVVTLEVVTKKVIATKKVTKMEVLTMKDFCVYEPMLTQTSSFSKGKPPECNDNSDCPSGAEVGSKLATIRVFE